MEATTITDQEASALLDRAEAVAERAYAPYSGFKVGAVLLAADGSFFEGVNIENAAYGSSLCAERAAVAGAISAGDQDFIAIAVAAAGDGDISPCGACRQVLMEFSPDMRLVTGGPGGVRVEKVSELLPRPFHL